MLNPAIECKKVAEKSETQRLKAKTLFKKKLFSSDWIISKKKFKIVNPAVQSRKVAKNS